MINLVLQRAVVLHNQGDLAGAERLYREVLVAAPDQPDALALLGVVLQARHQYDEATQLLEKAVAFSPDAAIFHFYLGNVRATLKNWDEAIEAYRQAVRIQSSYSDARYNMALALEQKGFWPEAIQHVREVLHSEPERGAAWHTLTDLALKTKNRALACMAGEQASKRLPDNIAALMSYGMALEMNDREEEALALFETAIKINPDFTEAWSMLGITYQNLNRLEDADHAFRKAIALAGETVPDEKVTDKEQVYGAQYWNLALLELLRGDLCAGFAHYRTRFNQWGWVKRLPYPQPLWRGEDVRGKTILVVTDQGFGDTLMMCRYLPLLKAKGARIVMYTDAALRPLFEGWSGIDAIVCEAPHTQSDFDYQTALFDLPHYFGTVLDSVPASIPYLPPPSVNEQTKLPATSKLKVGVVWAGRAEHGNDRRRSIPLETFAGMFAEPDIQFFSLARDLRAGDKELLARSPIIDLGPQITDFRASAQIVSQLDLIITCDTAMAHLAGGMGKRVWVLLPFAPEWRWMMKREDSPWYPTMRLFRRQTKTDWSGVIARVRAELRKL